MDQPMVFRKSPMITRLDIATKELTKYRAELEPNQWRTDVQARIATIDNILILIRERLYPTMPEPHEQKKAA